MNKPNEEVLNTPSAAMYCGHHKLWSECKEHHDSIPMIKHTPSAGEAPRSFGEWFKIILGRCEDYSSEEAYSTRFGYCSLAWNARDAQAREEIKLLEAKSTSSESVLRQELAQAKEEIAQLKTYKEGIATLEKLHMEGGAMEAYVKSNPSLSMYMATLLASLVADAPNYQEMHFTPAVANGTRITVTVQKLGHDKKTPHELRVEAEEKLAQMTTAFLTTEDALHTSKKDLAALEGKLGEMGNEA